MQVVNCYYTTDRYVGRTTRSCSPGLQFIRGYTRRARRRRASPAAERISDARELRYRLRHRVLRRASRTSAARRSRQDRRRVVLGGRSRRSGRAPGTPGAIETRTPTTWRSSTRSSRTGEQRRICDFGTTVRPATAAAGRDRRRRSLAGSVLAHALPTDEHAQCGRTSRSGSTEHGRPPAEQQAAATATTTATAGGTPLGSGRVDSANPITTRRSSPTPSSAAFRGNSVTPSSIRWLRLKADRIRAAPAPPTSSSAARKASQPPAATAASSSRSGFKGGLATDADEQPILFNDGIGSSQMGELDCTRSEPAGHRSGEVMNGCRRCTRRTRSTRPRSARREQHLHHCRTRAAVGRRLAAAPLRQDATDGPGQRPDRRVSTAASSPDDQNREPVPAEHVPGAGRHGLHPGRNYWKTTRQRLHRELRRSASPRTTAH